MKQQSCSQPRQTDSAYTNQLPRNNPKLYNTKNVDWKLVPARRRYTTKIRESDKIPATETISGTRRRHRVFRPSNLRPKGIPRTPSPNYSAKSVVVPPAPRLVGIELNPGPMSNAKKYGKFLRAQGMSHALVAATDAAAMLGAAVARKQQKSRKKQSKKVNKTQGTRSRSQTLRTTSAPVAIGTLQTSTLPCSTWKVPFKSTDFVVGNFTANSATSVANFADTGGQSTTRVNLGPIGCYQTISGASVFLQGAFGNSLRDLSALHREYRVNKLKVTYVPLVGSQTPGIITLYANGDPRSGEAASMSTANAFPLNLTTNVWQSASLDLSSIVGKNATLPWFYVGPTASGDANEEASSQGRITSLGMIGGFLTGIATNLTALTAFGVLRFEGEVEMRGLVPFNSLLPNVAVKRHTDENKSQDGPGAGNAWFPSPPVPMPEAEESESPEDIGDCKDTLGESIHISKPQADALSNALAKLRLR